MVVITVVRNRSFDPQALVDDFQAGRVEAALERLASAGDLELTPDLTRVEWWPRETRAPAVSELLTLPPKDLLESPDYPTLVAPLDRFREQPTAVRLREAPGKPLVFELTHMQTGLLAMKTAVASDATAIPFDIGLLPGADYQMALREVDASGNDGPIVALARFRWSPADEARAVGLAMATAHDMALPDHEGSSLLSAIVAFGYGFTDEAIHRLAELEDAPGSAPALRQVARELRALALQEQGLDWSAQQILLR